MMGPMNAAMWSSLAAAATAARTCKIGTADKASGAGARKLMASNSGEQQQQQQIAADYDEVEHIQSNVRRLRAKC